jgi:uncharacterized protein (DUF58 family)
MMPVPSVRLLRWGVAVVVASFAVVIFPSLWLLVLALDLLLAAAAFLDWFLSPRQGAIDAVRIVPERVSVLNPQQVAILVRNQSSGALRVRVRDAIPESFEAAVEEVGATVPARGQVRLEYQVVPKARGAFSWGHIHIRFHSLLGLWEQRRTIRAPAQSRVYPNLVALERYHLLARANRLESIGIRKVRMRGSAWEFESLRDYARGDDIRLIEWKATARRRKMIVRNQEAERNQTVLLLVDSGRLMNAEVDGVSKLDSAVNSALILAHVALSRGDRVGLCSFSHDVHAWVTPRAHKAQIRLLTEALYDLRGDFSESDHGRCLRLLATRYPKRALLIVFTDFVDSDTASEMVAHLRLAGRRHVVLFTALNDPLLARAAAAYVGDTFQGFRKAAAVELLRERKEVLEQLRRTGIHVLDVEPTGLTPPLVNRYLEITLRGVL